MRTGRRKSIAEPLKNTLIFWLVALFPLTPIAAAAPAAPDDDLKCLEVLKEIYLEVKELGSYPGQNFISREFFLGPADDDTYKNEHIAVLIQQGNAQDTMKIQITEMETVNTMPHVQTAKSARTIVCVIKGDRLSVQRSAYKPAELRKLAPEILRAIQEKKKLLKG
jgi:hypothetical protein